MTVRIMLDVASVQKLIDNPEAELELSRGVVAEILNRLASLKMGSILEQVEPVVLAQLRENAGELHWFTAALNRHIAEMYEQRERWSQNFKLTPTVEARLKDAVKPAQDAIIHEASMKIIKLVRQEVERKQSEVEAAIERRVENIQAEMIRQEVDRQVKAKMATILDAASKAQ